MAGLQHECSETTYVSIVDYSSMANQLGVETNPPYIIYSGNVLLNAIIHTCAMTGRYLDMRYPPRRNPPNHFEHKVMNAESQTLMSDNQTCGALPLCYVPDYIVICVNSFGAECVHTFACVCQLYLHERIFMCRFSYGDAHTLVGIVELC